MNIPLLIFDIICLPVIMVRIMLIYLFGSRYNIQNLKFLDVLNHSKGPYFNQDTIPSIDTMDENIRSIILEDTRVYTSKINNEDENIKIIEKNKDDHINYKNKDDHINYKNKDDHINYKNKDDHINYKNKDDNKNNTYVNKNKQNNFITKNETINNFATDDDFNIYQKNDIKNDTKNDTLIETYIVSSPSELTITNLGDYTDIDSISSDSEESNDDSEEFDDDSEEFDDDSEETDSELSQEYEIKNLSDSPKFAVESEFEIENKIISDKNVSGLLNDLIHDALDELDN
jgi:hypothetical protein